MISPGEISAGLAELGIPPGRPVIAHASLSAFGRVQGGAGSVVAALATRFQGVMMPVFTYKTMLIPEEGPPGNGLDYGSGKDLNRMAEFFDPDMPADRLMGQVPERLRRHPGALRSVHPILSFAGLGLDGVLAAQNGSDPLAPVAALAERDGWVLLLGVDHSVNTSIHYAEKLAGRKQFLRWALTRTGVQACPGFPGCSDGFEALAAAIEPLSRQARIGSASVRAYPLPGMLQTAVEIIQQDPLALLCGRLDCPRCNAVREGVS